jgi:hypothetical protein
MAQTSLGTITGTILDQNGAGVPNVSVTATAVASNLKYQGTSSADGTYTIGQLPIGAFTLEATAPGFKTYKQSNLTIEVSRRLRVDIKLEVGNVNESINITAEIPRVQTEDSSLGTTVERKRIEELPLNGRHVFNLVKIVAGVQPRFNNTDGFAEISNQNFSQIRINGGPAYGNQFFLDGSANSAPVHNEISVVPMSDAVEEFRVETNALKAEFGQTSGGVINVVTKMGGNEFHGSLYEFLRNDALDARNAFATLPDPRTGRIKQVLRYNQYGGTVGGPVRIPGLYDGRNKTFFFAGYEQWRWRSTGSPRLGTVAIPAWRTGNFSDLRNGLGQLIPLFDPATTRANPGGGFTRDPLPGNIVPANRIDPLSARVLQSMPLPNAPPTDPFTNANNFVALVPSLSDQGVTTVRLDHRFSQNDSVFFRYSSNRNTRMDRGFGLNEADPVARNDQRDNHNAVVNYTKVLNSKLVNDFRFAATRQWLPFLHPSFDQGWPAKLGYPSQIPQDQFPPVVIAGLLGIGSAGFSGGLRAQQYVQIVDGVNIIAGKHNVKTGFDLRWSRLSFINRVTPSGRFDFNAALTGNPIAPANTGFGLATYLLGEVSGGQIGFRPFFQHRSLPLGVYVQDDWKITRTLTINAGLRYDISWGPTELHNRHSSFDPFIQNPQTGRPGVLTYAGVGGRPESYVDLDRNNFGPRIGFAWDPKGDGKTAIRAGYGLIYTISEIGHTQGDNSNAFGFSVDTPFAGPAGAPAKAFQFSQGPSTILRPLGAAGGPSAARGFQAQYQDRNGVTPYVQQWNFTIQRALWGGWTASAVYAGSRGVKLFGGNYNLNQLDPRFLSQRLDLQTLVPNPFFGQIPGSPLSSGATVQRQSLLRAFPDYQNVQTFAANNAASTYHSLQVIVEKRFAAGLSALFSYTKSKLITDAQSIGGGGSATGLGDFRIGAYNRRLERAIDSDDISQRLVSSGVAEVPFGRGRKFGSDMPKLLDAIVGGWQLNGIATMQTGVPLMVRGSNNFTGINYPDLVSNPSLPRDQRSANGWFDRNAFRNPADFTIGNAPRTLPSTRGPGLLDVSFSVFKTFKIKERFRLESRWEMFNALNTVNLNNPDVNFAPNTAGVNTNANFSRIFSALDARRMQLGLRLTF